MTRYRACLFTLGTSLLLQLLFTIAPDLTTMFAFDPAEGLRGWVGILTYQVAHGSWSHLIGNFTTGLPFMAYLESRIGSKRALEFYVLCGVASALLFMLFIPGDSAIGSSGAVFGMIAGACLAFDGNLVERVIAIALFMLILIGQLQAAPMSALSGIAVYGHIGGALCGMVLSTQPYFRAE